MGRRPWTGMLGLLLACHPEAVAAVALAAGLLALSVGHPPASAALVAATVCASQLAVGWSNDAIDAPRDAAVGRRGKPVAAGLVSRRTAAVAAGVAGVATVGLALRSGLPAALVAVVALAGGLLYNWPLKASVVSVLPYAVSFAGLPAFVVLALPGAPPPPGWMVAAAGLLGAGAHFANVLPDLADDVQTGVRGLPHRLGPARSRWAAAGLLLAATAALALGPAGPPSWVGLAALLAAAVVLPIGWYAGRRRAASRAPFRAVLVVALLDVLLLLLAGRSV